MGGDRPLPLVGACAARLPVAWSSKLEGEFTGRGPRHPAPTAAPASRVRGRSPAPLSPRPPGPLASGQAAARRWSSPSAPDGPLCRSARAASPCAASTSPAPWWPACARSPAARRSASSSATHRWPDWSREPFSPESTEHVSARGKEGWARHRGARRGYFPPRPSYACRAASTSGIRFSRRVIRPSRRAETSAPSGVSRYSTCGGCRAGRPGPPGRRAPGRGASGRASSRSPRPPGGATG